MNISDTFRRNAVTPLVVESSDITERRSQIALSLETVSLNGKRLAEFRLSLLMGAALFASGLFHLTLFWVTGADWSGPVSVRKPGLFGVSAGLTVWSIAWVLTQLTPRRHDQRLANFMSGGLLLEVGLITLQQWRGVPSHFNRATTFDATVESIMLGLILLVTAGIAWLCWRSCRLQAMIESRAIAIRAGLWLLLISCSLGFMTTIMGELNLANGGPPKIWGRAGVLKYPHGAALHAIQTLPLLATLMQKFRVSHAGWHLRAAVASHVLFLTHALWQTLCGRARMDVDVIGATTLATAGLLLLWPLAAIAWGTVASAVKFRRAFK